MAHLHSVYDGDTHFKIIPVSRKIENTTGKVILMQNDHNSERFTFEIPRYIEGHDMSICNKVEIHYNNTDTKTKDVNKDVYEATDLQVSPDSEDVVICSWLISGNATKYAGSLYFVLRFACLTDSTIDYQWFTDIYKDITISKSIFNTETVAIDNSDILEQWKAELEALYGGGGVTESVVNEKIATAKSDLIGDADDETDLDTIHAAKNLARGLVNGLESKVVKTTELNNAINSALLQAKESGKFDGADGLSSYEIWLQQGNTGTKADFLASLKGGKGDAYTLTEADKDEIAETVKTEVPLVKVAEQPTFVDSIEEMTDKSKAYVLLPDGYFYRWRESKNYNLLKLSEVSYSSRLQNDVSGILSSTNANIVTGWIPVQYGKYYTPSILLNGERVTACINTRLVVRLNVKLSDGSIFVHNNNDFTWIVKEKTNETIKILHENAIAMQVQMIIENNDIGTSAKFEAFEPMIVEGDTIEEATNKSINSEYINADEAGITEWYNTGLQYNQPADYEERVVALESNVAKHEEDLEKLKNNITNPTSASPYFRNVNFGIVPYCYYKGLADSYQNEAFGLNTQYADFISLWKSLLVKHSKYVTETALGTASDGQTIYLYDFKPVRLSNQGKSIPKVILIAGQHGGETCNIFGLYYFVDNLLNKWNQHSALEYLRNNVELMIVPVLNTYGFDNKSYKNANGVNLNRNYDSNWTLVEDTTSNQYGGATPFDQPETQIVRDLILSNTDAVLLIDSHVNGGGRVDEYGDINYYGISASTDDYFNRMIDAVTHNLSAISANFNLDYDLEQPNAIFGFLNNADGVGILRNWARDKNLVSVLVEGFGGFPNRTSYAAEVFKANEEIIVNWLITALNYLSK